eukprot:SAG11_NODE_27070_length_337_cov_0.873950_1_plen_41_part_10
MYLLPTLQISLVLLWCRIAMPQNSNESDASNCRLMRLRGVR